MPGYAAQPYQQLAAAYRAEGHDRDVRLILMAQREDQLARYGLSLFDRCWGRLTGVLLGYGYQPWHALVGLVGVLAVSIALSVVLGAHGALERTPGRVASSTAAPPASAGVPAASEQCLLIERVGKGLDLGTPFLPRTTSSRCELTVSAAGVALTVSTWFLQLAVWALAALFVAGFTGIVRKT